jgi:TrmH family RNA methyltransferase
MKVIQLFKETNAIQRVLTLRSSRNSRHRYQEFIVEGRIALDKAYQNGWKIKALFYSQNPSLSEWAKYYLAQRKHDIAYEISPELMSRISDKTETGELLAIVETHVRSFTSYEPRREKEVLVVLDSPKSAGNMGMLIRSAACFGAHAVVISGHAADEYDPKCIRSSVGTFFSTPIYRVDGAQKFIEKVEQLKSKKSVRIIASGDQGVITLKEADFTGDLLYLVLGNETHGVSATYRQIAHQFVRIPLPGHFTSLNIAAAGSIFLYEIFCRGQ